MISYVKEISFDKAKNLNNFRSAKIILKQSTRQFQATYLNNYFYKWSLNSTFWLKKKGTGLRKALHVNPKFSFNLNFSFGRIFLQGLYQFYLEKKSSCSFRLQYGWAINNCVLTSKEISPAFLNTVNRLNLRYSFFFTDLNWNLKSFLI